MSPRALLAHMAFAALALAFAWQRAHTAAAKDGGPSSMILLDARAGDVAAVTYTWPQGSTRVTPAGTAPVRSAVVEIDRVLDAPKDQKKPGSRAPSNEASKDGKAGEATAGANGPQAEADGGQAGPPASIAAPAEREQARFPGGKTVLASVESLEPLKTRRTLGAVDEARLRAMGLESSQRTLTVTTTSGRSITVDVGEQAYGGQGRYARVRGDDVVHLLEPAVVTGLEGTLDSLLEKRIVTADVADLVSYKVASSGQEKTFLHAHRDQPQKRRFVPQDDTSSTDDRPGKLMASLRNLRGTKLVNEAELTAASVTAVVRLELEDRAPLVAELLERGDAGYAVKVGSWAWQVSETQARELLGDITAALD